MFQESGLIWFYGFYDADAIYAIRHARPAVVIVVRVVVNPHSSHGEMHLVMPTLPYSPTHLKETDLNRAVPLCILLLFCAFLQEKRGYPTPGNAILHPILHRKPSVNTTCLGHGCRKCRIFFQNIFRRERRDIGPGIKEGGLPSWFIERPLKTSDFFGQKYGCFASKVRMFASKKSDVFDFRKGESIEYGDCLACHVHDSNKHT